ncbi:hypothetical protein PPERSA_05809 [Pseudocohnilembus persalinus]|uniref:Uncharacterized protein n=1 Tax=Pseudocohnilembus persalinus TaxID=266149 RepID=A0A0V0QGD2_PSEPJ|nr:hypothetical protein PPERSA_05809 [Pseudocohnilembus persalinus]|eukprot:KRX01223.1 hypothetical protein PPERSA_05809 [Pseudocohnilembus persalinus]
MEEKQKQKLKQIDQEQNNTSQSIHLGQHSINETAMTLNLKQDNQLKTDQTQHFIQQHYNNINNSNSVNINQNGEQSSFLNITNSLQQIQSPNQSFNVNNNNTSFANKKKKSQKGSKQHLSQSHINSNYISILNGIGSEHNMESLRSSRKIQMLQKRGSQKSTQNLQKLPDARLSLENQNEGLELSNRSGLSRNAQSVKTQRNNRIKNNLSTVNPNKLPNIINFYEDEIMKIEEYNYMLQKNKEIEQQFYQQKKTIKSIKSQTNLIKKSKYSDFKYQDAITGQSFVRQVLHQKSLIGRAEPYESAIRNKKINQYNNILSQTEDERNQRKLKQQNNKQQNTEAKLMEDENDKYINDSSEDENDNFIQEIIVQEIVQKSEDESIFKLEREKQMRFSQNKKKNEKDQDQGILQLVDFGGNKVKHIKRLAHQSNNRQTTNFKLLTGKDLLSLSKQRKRIHILTNYLNQFQALEKQKKEQQLYDEQKKNTQQHQYNNSNTDILNESKVPKYQKRQGLKKFF